MKKGNRRGVSAVMVTVVLAAVSAKAETVEERLAALEQAKGSGLQVHLEFVGFYNQSFDADEKKNRGSAFSSVDVIFEGQAADNVALVLDIEQQDVARNIGISEAFAEISLLDEALLFQGGVVDLTGIFDAAEYANDENSQFIRDEFVNSAALGNPDNGLGFAFVYNLSDGIAAKVGFQDERDTALGAPQPSDDPFDYPYFIYELEAGHGLAGGGALRTWLRETGRGFDARAYGLGVVVDQAVGKDLGLSLRGARELPRTVDGVYTNTGAGGRAFTSLMAAVQGNCFFRAGNVWGAAWATTHHDQGPSGDSAEIYYKFVFNDNCTFSLHYSEDFSQMVVPHVQADGSVDFGAVPATQRAMARLFLAH